MTSPTQRTLAEARKRGWLADVVEKWIPGANIRKDLFGFIDVVAVTEDGRTIGIQATDLTSVSKRVQKIADSEIITPRLRRAGWVILVWGWGKQPNGRYRLREVDCS